MIPVAEGSAEDEQLRKGMILVGAVCAFMISTPLTVADDWPQFRGIHRNGVSHEKAVEHLKPLLTEFGRVKIVASGNS